MTSISLISASLISAVKRGNVEKVRTLLQQGKWSVNDSVTMGRTPLHYACKSGHLNVVRLLLSEFKADLTIRGYIGCTPLHCAAENGHLDVVRVLVSEFKANVRVEDDLGRIALHYACEEGHLDVVRVLVSEYKAGLTIPDNRGFLPFHYAIEKGHLEVIRVFVSEFKVDLSIRDKYGFTPLHYACKRSQLEVVILLLSESKAHLTIPDKDGFTSLHYACRRNQVNVVKILLFSENKAHLTTPDKDGCIPLHYACQLGHLEIVKMLMSEVKVKADLTIQDKFGRTPLHCACKENHVDIVKIIVSGFEDCLTMDRAGQTPLHYACKAGNLDIAKILVSGFKDGLTIQDHADSTPLHYACDSGHLGIVRMLVSEFKADLSIRDIDGRTALMLAARRRHEDVVLALLRDYQCPVTDRDKDGWGVLHHACAGGNVRLVHAIIQDYKADVNAIRDKYSDIVVVNECINVAFFLICKYGFDPNVADKQGQTPLHYACERGDVDLVHALIHEYKADLNICNKQKNTPLHLAFKAGHTAIVLALLNDPSCDPNICDEEGKTVLHLACITGNMDIVKTLLCMHEVDINVCTNKQDTPLHMAAWGGHYNVVLVLVREARCDYSARDNFEKTALHIAAFWGYHKIAEVLQKLTSPLAIDKFGNTPLHYACQELHVNTVKCLLHDNAPVLVRNAEGNTPRDLAWGECERIVEQYIQNTEFQIHYSTIFGLAEKKYSGAHWITRIFVLGNPGAGKSSFVESLKREGFFKSFSKVSESSVPPHTAGIIPSVHMSSQYGRVLFYDFAGDAEYYSSHAAIFENLASSRRGDNIFIVVVDLREATIISTLHYWFSFIQYQKFSKSSFVIVGSHIDQAVERSQCLDEFCTTMQPNVYNIKHFTLDCRDPRSSQITQFKKQISVWIRESQKYELFSEARLLLGLLEKDFSAVTACSVRTLISHIKDIGVWLPVQPSALHKILLELHEVGVLLLLGDCNKESDHIILNISELTNQVHELLFSSKSSLCNEKGFNIGILPESVLEEILPQYITKECLIHLQYCQKISHTDICLFPSLEQDDSSSQSFLFFPALCSVDKSQVSWVESTNNSFSIGWLALCTDPQDYFPPRFLHVLLLRLIYGFTLSAQLQTPHASPAYSRCCTMWKKGVHWLMEEGVDCMVELVKGSKGVVVLSKSSMDAADDCARIFTEVVSCVMKAKAEFCYSIKPEFYFLDSCAEADYFNEDHQFKASKAKESLKNPEGKRVIISVSNRGKVELSNLLRLKRFTLWNSFFPFELEDVLHTLRVIVREIFELGLVLGVPFEIRESIEVDFSSVEIRRMKLVSWWMDNSSKPPCWHTLVEALEDIDRSILAEEIKQEHGLHIKLQEKMLDNDNQALKPDGDFLRSLSTVVGSRWPSLAVTLELNEKDIKGLKKMTGLSQQELALQMLKIWASREDATYGLLCHKLKTILLFQYLS